MIFNTVTKTINLVKIVWEGKARIFAMEVSNNFKNGRRELLEEWMIDEFGETVKGELVKELLSEKHENDMKMTYYSFHDLVQGTMLGFISIFKAHDSSELLKCRFGQLSLFNKISLSVHVGSGSQIGSRCSVHIKCLRENVRSQ
jgi:hypothetical protein